MIRFTIVSLFLFLFCQTFVSAQNQLAKDQKLMRAAKAGNIDSLKDALEDGAYPNTFYHRSHIFYRETYDPMLCVLDSNRKDMAELLIQHGYDLNKTWANGRRLIDYYLDTLTWVLPFLIENGADFRYSSTFIMEKARTQEVRNYLSTIGADEADPEFQGYDSYKDTVYITFILKAKSRQPLTGHCLVSREKKTDNWNYINGTAIERIQVDGNTTITFPVYYTRKEFFEKRLWRLHLILELDGYRTMVAHLIPGPGAVYEIRLKKGKKDIYDAELIPKLIQEKQ